MWLFRKKKNKEIPTVKSYDFDKYQIKLNAKAIMLYEKLTGKSFIDVQENEEDALKLMYAVLVANNPKLRMTYNAFLIFIQDEKIVKWMTDEYQRILKYNGQFNENLDNLDSEKKEEAKKIKLTDIVTSLIANYGIDPYYVMNDMELWEMPLYSVTITEKKQDELEEERLWTYLNILPHIDGKKLKSPEQLLPFPWEKDNRKKRAEQGLKENEYAIKHTIGTQLNI